MPNFDTIGFILVVLVILNLLGLATHAYLIQLHTRTLRDLMRFRTKMNSKHD